MNRILRVVTLIVILLTVTRWSEVSAAITSVTAITENICYGANHGSININPVGGTAPYSYSWSNGATTQNATNLIAGTYTVTVTDNTGTTAGFTYSITQPTALIITRAVTNENCGGQNIGTITLNITNPSSVYTFHWSNGATTENLVNLTAAEYYVTITDAIGCTTIDSADVIQPPGIGITDTVTGVSCSAGMNNGAIAVGVQYGNAPYTFLWNDAITTQSRTGLTTGTYTLTVTDNIGCSTSASITVSQLPRSMSVNTSGTNPTCYGAHSGSATVISSVGSPGPYTYLWTGGATTQTITGLAAGTYTVTSTSSTGCSASATVTLTQPASMTATIHPFPPTCYGGNNGAITSAGGNGSSPYIYAWTGGYSTATISSLTAGTYVLTVTDHHGCTLIDTVTLTQPTPVSVTATATQLTCSGAATGIITTSVTGGTSPYSYLWNLGATSPTRSHLSAGNYSVTVSDANGCTGTATATINPYMPMSLATAATSVVCYGSNNGALNLTVTNGTAPYSYIWNNGNNTSNPDTLIVGNYTATVTDAKGCTVTTSASVPGPPFAIVVNDTISDVSCFGLSDGSISLNPVYGTPPYIYKWSGVGNSSLRTNLSAGTYTCSISDNNGCTAISNYTVTQPALITPTTAVTNVSCFGGNNGAINLSVTGGFSPFGYSWNDGVHTQTRSTLHNGTYTVTITDNHGCTMTSGATITQPTLLTVSAVGTNPACNTGGNGSISASASGGTSPYRFNWGLGITTPNQTGLTAGTYTVTVTDTAGCTASASQTLTAPTALSIALTPSAILCGGGSTGTITNNTTGGTSPYTYDWGSGITTQNRSNLAAGTYTVTVTDHNLCTGINSASITQASGLSASATATNVSCFGGSNGAITLSVTGGTAPISYSWNDGAHTLTRTSLHNGSYTVTITDNLGCTTASGATVTQPTQLTVIPVGTSPTCSNNSNGSVSTTVTGGTLPYSFNWGLGVTTQNRAALSAGTYSVTVTDSAGCTASASQSLTAPTALSIALTGSAVSCSGGNTGTIINNTSGGTAPYTYDWGNSITTQNRSNLAGGIYTVTVTDHNLCTGVNSASITQTSGLTASATATNVLCFGGNNGTIHTIVTGGTAPYTYDWGGGITSSQRNNLTAGTYNVIITDHAGCQNNITTSVTQPPLLTVSATTTPVTCFGGASGAIHITTAGGTGTDTYNWNGNITTQNRSSLAAGSYSLTVTDSAGCTVSSSSTVAQPTQLTAASTQTNISCNGGNDGTIQITPAGGTGGYTITWSSGFTGNRTALAQGSYTATITDANGCSITNTSNITQPGALTASAATTNVTCFGLSNGAINLTVGGGTGPYTYNWGGVTTQNRTGLAAGNYAVTVTDAPGCTVSVSASITQPTQITVSTSSVTNASCFGSNNGSINITAGGGTPALTYLWSNGATTQNISNAIAGSYTVSVTDAHSCSVASSSISITQPTAVTIATNAINVLCNGGSTGAATALASGGNGNFSYRWSNTATVANISNLTAGTYTITCRDALNCSASATAQVTEPTAIILNPAHTDVTCNGGNTGTASVSPTGGAGGYNYTWTNNQTTAQITQLAQGSYSVTLHDANACPATTAITVSQINSIVLNLTPTAAGCAGQTNGSIQSTVSGGAGSYTYSWTNGLTTANIMGIAAGSYTVTVTDANHCNSIASSTITQPTAITLTQVVTNATCFGSATGGIQVTGTGGTGGYHYLWSNGATSQNLQAVVAGSYSVTVTDVNGCSVRGGRSISQPTQLDVSINGNDVTCFGGNNGSATSTVTGGNTPYSYLWSNNSTTGYLNNAIASNYTLTVKDAQNCTATSSISIAQPMAITIHPTVTDVSCNGANNGAVSVQASGGAGNYTYNWSNHSTQQQLGQLPAGSYTVTVQDASACTANTSVSITQPQPVSVTTTSVAVGCSGHNDGSATATVAGGTPPFLYNWSNLQKTVTADSLAVGSYSITVTDNNGCTANNIFTITSAPPLSAIPTITNANCPGVNNGSISISTTGGTTPYTYNWNTGLHTSTATALAGGSYAVTITDAKGCTAQSGGSVGNGYELTIQAYSSVDTANNTPVQLTSTTNTDHGNTYNWTPANIVTCNTCQNTASKPTETTTYTVYVIDTNGCKAESAVTVIVNTPPVNTPVTSTTIFIPNAFTPNGDGQNDEFKIFGSDLGDVNFIDIAVFDRWGEKVFESNDPNFTWDGIYKGQPAPQGVYVYVATVVFNTGEHKDFKGSVTLIR